MYHEEDQLQVMHEENGTNKSSVTNATKLVQDSCTAAHNDREEVNLLNT
jgi:hypothetical protein